MCGRLISLALAALLLSSSCVRPLSGPKSVEESTALLEDSASPADRLPNEELFRTFDLIHAAYLARSEAGEAQLANLSCHRDFLIRIRAVKALSDPFYLRREAALEVLQARLEDRHWLVRSFAAKGLGKSGQPSVLPALRHGLLCEDNAKVRTFLEAAIAALER